MITAMENSKKHSIAFSVIALVVLVIAMLLEARETTGTTAEDRYRLVLLKKDTGAWYYEIYDDRMLTIRQECVPGIPGNIDFLNRKSAETAGRLVLSKLRNGQLPVLSMEELEINGINN